jgi:translocation and assembly module TamA
MIGRGSRLGAARLLCAAAAVACSPCGVAAQSAPPDPAELDPSAPLAPLPDLGVAWPDLNASEAAPAPDETAVSPPKKAERAPADGGGNIRYMVVVEGLAPIGNAEELLEAFRKQSTLEEEHKHPANAAQIGRRAGADAELLAEILRSQGYYDAVVEPRTENVGTELRVILGAEPGQQYRFASVDLPGLEAAGPHAAGLRDAFAVRPGDPVIAADVIAGGLALTQALGERGFAGAKIGDRDIEVNHQTHLATLTLPVNPGPIARFGTIRVSGRPPFSARLRSSTSVQRAPSRNHRPFQARRPVPALRSR